METTVIEHKCPAQPENYAKFKLHFDYIAAGIAYNTLTMREVNNLIRTSGLSRCDKALLRKELNERVQIVSYHPVTCDESDEGNLVWQSCHSRT